MVNFNPQRLVIGLPLVSSRCRYKTPSPAARPFPISIRGLTALVIVFSFYWGKGLEEVEDPLINLTELFSVQGA